jgi:ABC-type glycerol-3-phosphate transport system substrate-binding protein
MWNYFFTNADKRACRRMRGLLTAQIDDRLPDDTAARLAAHLADCPRCRQWVRQEEALRDRLRYEIEPPHAINPAAALRNRQRIQQRIRRKSIMWHTKQALQGAATLVVLAALTAVFIFWQRQTVQPLLEATPPAVSETEHVTLTLAVDGGSLPHYRPLIAAFEQENEDIRVRLVSLDEVANPGESGIRALATSFDVFAYSPNRQGDTQFLLDLRPLLALDPAFDANDFLPGLLPPDSEPLWAVPTGAAYYLTFFDKSAFDAAGLPYPELDWTAEEFLTAAQTLTLRENDNVTQWGYVPGQMRYPTLLAARLTGPLDSGDSLRLTDPDVAAAVQWVSDLFTLHQVAPWLDDYRPLNRRAGEGQPTGMALVNSGMAAMWHTTHLLYDENDDNMGVTAVPRGPYGYAADPLIYALAASRGTANPEAAWKLLDFLSRQPPPDTVFTINPVPARQSVAVSANYWPQLPDSLLPALEYAAENNVASRVPFAAANPLQEAFAAHIDDNAPAAVALGQQPAQIAPPPETEVEVIVVPAAPAEDDGETTRITFTTGYVYLDAHRRLARQFNEENPTIHVTIAERDEYAATPLGRVARSDCFLGGVSYVEDGTVRPALLPLGPLLEVDDTLRLSDFYPIMVEPMIVDGQVWGIPAGASAPFLEYNTQIFAEAGLPPPPLDWTLADFLEVAAQLTHGEGDEKRYGYVEPFPYMRLGFLQAFGVEMIDNSVNPPRIDFAAAAEMISWYVDLVQLYEAQPLIPRGPGDHQEFETLVRNGRAAIWTGGYAAIFTNWGAPRLQFEVGYAALPLPPGGYRSGVSPGAYHIVADSPHRQACWEWIKFLSTQPTAVQAANTTARLMPAHIATAESEAFVEMVGAEMAAILQNHLNGPPPPPGIPSDWISGWISPAFHLLRNAYLEAAGGESDVATALANADFQFSQYRQCVIDRNGFDNYNDWRLCAIELGPDFAWLYPERSD